MQSRQAVFVRYCLWGNVLPYSRHSLLNFIIIPNKKQTIFAVCFLSGISIMNSYFSLSKISDRNLFFIARIILRQLLLS